MIQSVPGPSFQETLAVLALPEVGCSSQTGDQSGHSKRTSFPLVSPMISHMIVYAKY